MDEVDHCLPSAAPSGRYSRHMTTSSWDQLQPLTTLNNTADQPQIRCTNQRPKKVVTLDHTAARKTDEQLDPSNSERQVPQLGSDAIEGRRLSDANNSKTPISSVGTDPGQPYDVTRRYRSKQPASCSVQYDCSHLETPSSHHSHGPSSLPVGRSHHSHDPSSLPVGRSHHSHDPSSLPVGRSHHSHGPSSLPVGRGSRADRFLPNIHDLSLGQTSTSLGQEEKEPTNTNRDERKANYRCQKEQPSGSPASEDQPCTSLDVKVNQITYLGAERKTSFRGKAEQPSGSPAIEEEPCTYLDAKGNQTTYFGAERKTSYLGQPLDRDQRAGHRGQPCPLRDVNDSANRCEEAGPNSSRRDHDPPRRERDLGARSRYDNICTYNLFVWKYMWKCRDHTLQKLMGRYQVDLKEVALDTVGDTACDEETCHVAIVTPDNGDIHKAKKALSDLYEQVASFTKLQTFNLSSAAEAADDDVMQMVLLEVETMYPNVVVVCSDGEVVIAGAGEEPARASRDLHALIGTEVPSSTPKNNKDQTIPGNTDHTGILHTLTEVFTSCIHSWRSKPNNKQTSMDQVADPPAQALMHADIETTL